MSVLVDTVTARIQLRMGAMIIEAETLQQELSDTRRHLADAQAEIAHLKSMFIPVGAAADISED